MENCLKIFAAGAGLPAPHSPGRFLIKHSEYGWMISQWDREGSLFFGCGINSAHDVPQVVLFKDEQAERAIQWIQIS